MKERWDKGLCYNCDDKWNPAYKCKSPKLFLMHGCDVFSEEKLEEVFCDDLVDDGDPPSDLIVTEVSESEISLHAITGSVTPKTMHLYGMLHMHQVVVLLDTGSTHNFLDPAVLRKVPLQVTSDIQLQVRVTYGATILSAGLCSAVSLKL